MKLLTTTISGNVEKTSYYPWFHFNPCSHEHANAGIQVLVILCGGFGAIPSVETHQFASER
ncbi:unnamed protein product, partial [Nesidiocoris tenuis]